MKRPQITDNMTFFHARKRKRIETWMQESMRMVSGRRDGKTYMFPHRTIRHTVWTGPEKVFIDSCSGAQRYTTLEVEIRACDNFSDGYSATRPTRNCHQKYSRKN